jgi:DNA adenine methylase
MSPARDRPGQSVVLDFERSMSLELDSVAANRASEPSAAPPDTLRPPLKWAGGKRWQVPIVWRYWQPERHRRLVEPFCGGLAVTLGLMPARALLNDVNPHLINFYRHLQRGLTIDMPMSNSRTRYYAARKAFNRLVSSDMSDSQHAAELFYYLNRTGYNGLCRFNRSGLFNVPFGRHMIRDYRRDFTEYAAVFANWEFTSVSFDEVPLQPDDFVYADPPYDVEFTNYSKNEFGWEQQEQTAVLLARHPGPVVLSNQRTDKIDTLYRSLGYRVTTIKAPRRISCNGDRAPATEVLAVRNLPDALP